MSSAGSPSSCGSNVSHVVDTSSHPVGGARAGRAPPRDSLGGAHVACLSLSLTQQRQSCCAGSYRTPACNLSPCHLGPGRSQGQAQSPCGSRLQGTDPGRDPPCLLVFFALAEKCYHLMARLSVVTLIVSALGVVPSPAQNPVGAHLRFLLCLRWPCLCFSVSCLRFILM